MKRLLLDTSAYSALRKGHTEIGFLTREADELYLDAIVLGEIFAGFARGRRGEENRAEFERFASSPRVNVIEIDEVTAERYAVIFATLRTAGTPIPTNDMWIAASAMQHGLQILTLDPHFKKVPQVITHLLS